MNRSKLRQDAIENLFVATCMGGLTMGIGYGAVALANKDFNMASNAFSYVLKTSAFIGTLPTAVFASRGLDSLIRSFNRPSL